MGCTEGSEISFASQSGSLWVAERAGPINCSSKATSGLLNLVSKNHKWVLPDFMIRNKYPMFACELCINIVSAPTNWPFIAAFDWILTFRVFQKKLGYNKGDISGAACWSVGVCVGGGGCLASSPLGSEQPFPPLRQTIWLRRPVYTQKQARHVIGREDLAVAIR